MSAMHELEKRADQHRLEALKKIDAVTQERGDDVSSSGETTDEAISDFATIDLPHTKPGPADS